MLVNHHGIRMDEPQQSKAPKSVKKSVLATVLAALMERNVHPLIYDNDMIKSMTQHTLSNQFDVSKMDNSANLPPEFVQHDLFVVNLGGGRHQVVKGINLGYHKLEPVPPERVRNWEYKPSILDATDISEAGILSIAFNQQIISHFLYKDRTVPLRIHLNRRTRAKDYNTFSYKIGDEEVNVKQLQIEMDFIVEKNGHLALAEAKCKGTSLPDDFAVVQIYLPYRRLLNMLGEQLTGRKLRNLFIIQYVLPDGMQAIRVYEYTFEDPLNMGSIKFVNNAEYRLEMKGDD
jgi:hypothetical protein